MESVNNDDVYVNVTSMERDVMILGPWHIQEVQTLTNPIDI